MSVVYELEKIKEIMKKPCNITKKVSFIVNNYNEVLSAWKAYKKNYLLEDRKDLRSIFDFHNSEINHIILYWSSNQKDCLLMCKIKEKYINIRIPMTLTNINYSFIATYT